MSFLEYQPQLSNLDLSSCELDATTIEAVLSRICQSDYLQTMQELNMGGNDLSEEVSLTQLNNFIAAATQLKKLNLDRC